MSRGRWRPSLAGVSIEFSPLAPSRADRRGGTLYPAQFTHSFQPPDFHGPSLGARADSRLPRATKAVAVTRAADSEGGSDDAVGPR